MPLVLVHMLALITGLVLIALVFFVYLRSRAGDRRAINFTNVALLPVLSIIVIVLNSLFANHQIAPIIPACAGPLNVLRYAGVIGVIVLVLAGCVRYFSDPNRDRRLLSHPVLFSVILVTIVFLIEYLNGCL